VPCLDAQPRTYCVVMKSLCSWYAIAMTTAVRLAAWQTASRRHSRYGRAAVSMCEATTERLSVKAADLAARRRRRPVARAGAPLPRKRRSRSAGLLPGCEPRDREGPRRAEPAGLSRQPFAPWACKGGPRDGLMLARLRGCPGPWPLREVGQTPQGANISLSAVCLRRSDHLEWSGSQKKRIASTPVIDRSPGSGASKW
jgi:hypothetical protein